MFLIYLCCVAIIAIQAINCTQISYENYRSYELKMLKESQIEILEKLENEERSIIFIDPILRPPPTTRNGPIAPINTHVLVSPEANKKFQNLLATNKIKFELVNENFQNLIKEEKYPMQQQRSLAPKAYDWTTYHPLNETYAWFTNLSESYPKIVEVIKGGSTYEGRDILGVKLSYKNGNKGIFIEAGIHAREWIGPATATYILNQLLTSTDTDIRFIAENFDWYIFPHTNPDGFVYTRTKDRLWRKTRSINKQNKNCIGVDPNRNWDIFWMKNNGASSNPCSDAYGGPKPFSEIEVKSLSDYISKDLKGKLNVYISFHAYGQLLLYPYGYKSQLAKNNKDLKQIGTAAANALAKRYKKQYKVGNMYTTIYPVSGSSIDWVYDKQNITLSYCYELRPHQNNGGGKNFVLPPNQIVPTGEETLDSLVAFLKEAQKLKYF